MAKLKEKPVYMGWLEDGDVECEQGRLGVRSRVWDFFFIIF